MRRPFLSLCLGHPQQPFATSTNPTRETRSKCTLDHNPETQQAFTASNNIATAFHSVFSLNSLADPAHAARELLDLNDNQQASSGQQIAAAQNTLTRTAQAHCPPKQRHQAKIKTHEQLTRRLNPTAQTPFNSAPEKKFYNRLFHIYAKTTPSIAKALPKKLGGQLPAQNDHQQLKSTSEKTHPLGLLACVPCQPSKQRDSQPELCASSPAGCPAPKSLQTRRAGALARPDTLGTPLQTA